MGWFQKLFDHSPIASAAEHSNLTKSISRLDVAVENLAEKVLVIQSESEYNRMAFAKLLDDALSVVKKSPRARP